MSSESKGIPVTATELRLAAEKPADAVYFQFLLLSALADILDRLDCLEEKEFECRGGICVYDRP